MSEDKKASKSKTSRAAIIGGLLAIVIVICLSLCYYLLSPGQLLPGGWGMVKSLSTPLPTATLPLDASRLVDEALEKLTPGQIVFNPPEEMTTGVEERIEASIAKSTTITTTQELIEGLQGRGEPQVEQILVNTFMTVSLKGNGENFDIQALTEEEQAVTDELPGIWQWDVTPLKSGTQKLNLAVTIRIVIPGIEEQYKAFPVFTKEIKVAVNPGYSIHKFWESNWQWLIAAVAAVIGGIWAFFTWGIGFISKIIELRRNK